MNIDATPGGVRAGRLVPDPGLGPGSGAASCRDAADAGRHHRGGRGAQAVPPRRRLVKWNEYEGPYFTIRVGGGFLYEGAWFAQDEESEQQFDLTAQGKVRDARFRPQRALLPQVEAGGHLFGRTHVRRPHRRVPRAGDRDHGRGARAVGPHLRRPHQGRVLPEQGHDRLLGLDDGALHDQRRHHPDPGRRHQVARLPAQAAHPLEPRRLRRTGSPRGRASRPTTRRSSAAWPGFPSPTRRPAPSSTSG